MLVELEPGLACLFGETVPKGVEIIRPLLLPDVASNQIGTAVGTALVAANLAAQAGGAVGMFQGLVQLTPATLKALQTATPLTSGGVNLGSLVDASGHIVHSVQWVPAGAAGVAAGLAAVGPAVALLAIQLQLAKITSLVQENLALTDEVLRAVRVEQWAEVTGLHEAMLKAVDEARHVGVVSDPIWQNVQGHEAILRKVRKEFREKVGAHLSSLHTKPGYKERREYLDHHGEAILQDAQALIMAQSAWFTYQAIRAGHLYQRADTDPTSGSLLQKVVDDARAVYDQDLRTTSQLLQALHRRLSLMAELPGKPTLPIGKGKRAAKDVARASRLLLDQLTLLEHGIDLPEPPLQAPVIAAFENEVPELLPRVLRWHLERDEQLLAAASAKCQGWPVGDWSYIAVTDQRLLIADQGDLKRHGEVGTSIPLDDIRYVRFTPARDEGRRTRGRLDITTPSTDLHLTFADWAAEESHWPDLARLAQLVSSSMRLPADEVPASPLADDLPATDDQAGRELAAPEG
jgi:hypothetical protein